MIGGRRGAKAGAFVAAIFFALTGSGCAFFGFSQQTHFARPDRPITGPERFFVIRHPEDSWNVGGLIAERLRKDGLDVGEGDTPPSDAEVVVTYEDRWQWDITMYMLSLKIDLRDARTDELLATSQSFRTSLRRRTPVSVVDEVLGSVLPERVP